MCMPKFPIEKRIESEVHAEQRESCYNDDVPENLGAVQNNSDITTCVTTLSERWTCETGLTD